MGRSLFVAMTKDEEVLELSALLEQERAYVAVLRGELSDLKAMQQHMISGLEVWKEGFERLYHEHHVLAGSKRLPACSVCLRQGAFPLSELTRTSSDNAA